MNERLVLGKYIDIDSIVHRLDPRSKIISMVLYLALIFLVDTWLEAALLVIVSIAVMSITRIPLSMYWKAVKPLRFLIVFIALFQMLFTEGETVYWSAGAITVSGEGIAAGAMTALRMSLFISFTSMLNFTTPPARLMRGLEQLLHPFRRIGLSPQRWTLMIQIALRFIPTLFAEAENILKAQASRGADIRELPLRKKAETLVALLVPVIVGALRRATELTEAMEIRGYRLGQPRTNFHLLTWRATDTWFITMFAILVVVAICLA